MRLAEHFLRRASHRSHLIAERSPAGGFWIARVLCRVTIAHGRLRAQCRNNAPCARHRLLIQISKRDILGWVPPALMYARGGLVTRPPRVRVEIERLVRRHQELHRRSHRPAAAAAALLCYALCACSAFRSDLQQHGSALRLAEIVSDSWNVSEHYRTPL